MLFDSVQFMQHGTFVKKNMIFYWYHAYRFVKIDFCLSAEVAVCGGCHRQAEII